jgi:hypothetical protein
MSINNSQRAGFPNELLATMTGSTVLIGTLIFNPVMIIFDNMGTVPVAISVNDSTGVTTWKTFDAGEALVLDLRCQQGRAPNFTFDLGTTFFGTGASSNFSISYIYAKEPS